MCGARTQKNYLCRACKRRKEVFVTVEQNRLAPESIRGHGSRKGQCGQFLEDITR